MANETSIVSTTFVNAGGAEISFSLLAYCNPEITVSYLQDIETTAERESSFCKRTIGNKDFVLSTLNNFEYDT